MNRLLLTALLACVIPAARGAGAEISVRAPLAPLASRLRVAIPALNDSSLLVASPVSGAMVVPSIYASARAEALLRRLEELGVKAARDGGQASKTEAVGLTQAKTVVSAVNAVLGDFTPEEVSRLPAGDVRALSGVLFEHMGARRPADPKADLAAAVVLSQAAARRVLALRGKIEETLLNPRHNENHPDDILVRGVPETTRLVPPTLVFRHYTTEEGYESILKSGALWNGFIPYVVRSPGTFKKSYIDLNGVFLSLPGVVGDDVGVPARIGFTRYVDVIVSAGVSMLEIEAGRIFMIPLPARMRDWALRMYQQWADGGAVDGTYRKMIADIDAAGGPGPDLAIPVKIVSHGRAK